MVKKFSPADASFEPFSRPGWGDLCSECGGPAPRRPITIGYGRYGPDQELAETLAVDDVMVVIEGRLSVTDSGGTVTAGSGEIIYMLKGEKVTIRSHERGAVAAYVTYPHWQEARE